MTLFSESGDELLGSLAADIISYFGYSAELMDAPSRAAERLVSFNHDPAELLAQMQAGNTNLEELVFSLPPLPCEALLRWYEGEVSIQGLRERLA